MELSFLHHVFKNSFMMDVVVFIYNPSTTVEAKAGKYECEPGLVCRVNSRPITDTQKPCVGEKGVGEYPCHSHELPLVFF